MRYVIENQDLEFVGIVENIHPDGSSYYYCNLNTDLWGVSNPSIESLGEMIACKFGSNFRQRITYKPLQGIHGLKKIGLWPIKYHQLSVLEKDRFEKAVLNALKGR